MTTKKTKASKKVEDNGRNVYSALITTLGKP